MTPDMTATIILAAVYIAGVVGHLILRKKDNT